MAISKTEKHFIVEIAFKKISDASTKTISVSDRSFGSGELYNGSPEILGILESISGFGQSMGEVVAKIASGTVNLKATRNSYAFAKRIYDLLEDYLIVDQPVVCYAFERKRDIIGSNTDRVAEFTGTATSYKIDTKNQTFQIAVQAKNFSSNLVNKRFTDLENSDFYIADDFEIISTARNKVAPVIFGEDVVMPLTPLYLRSWNLIGNYGSIGYGAASRIGDIANRTDPISEEPFPLNSFQNLTHYLKNESNEFESIVFGIGSNRLYGYNYNAAKYADLIFTDLTPSPDKVYTHYIPISFAQSTAEKVYSNNFTLQGQGQNNGALVCDGSVKFELYTANLTDSMIANGDFPNNLIPIAGTIVELSKSIIASNIRGSVVYPLSLSFSKPIILRKDQYYWLKISETGAPTAKEFVLNLVNANAANLIIYSEETTSFDKTPQVIVTANDGQARNLTFNGWYDNRLYDMGGDLVSGLDNANFFDIQFTNTATSTITSESDVVRNFIPEIKTLLSGYQDRTGLVISASELFHTGHDILKLLYYLQNGNSLTGWDNSRFPSAEALSENIDGLETKEITYRNLMLGIAEADSAALIINRDGTVSYWTYGTTQSISAVFTERDCTLESVDSTGIESVVNKINLYYGEAIDLLANSATTNISYENELFESSAESIATYGTRENSANFTSNNWIKNTATAQKYADYKLAQYEFERFEFVINTAYWNSNYRTLELWDLVELNHIDAPSIFGSSPPNQTKNLFDGVDWAIGDALRHAKSYYCRIIDRVVEYDLNGEARITFKLRALNRNEIGIG